MPGATLCTRRAHHRSKKSHCQTPTTQTKYRK